MREELNGALRVRLREKLGEREVFGLDCNPWSRLGEKAQWGGGTDGQYDKDTYADIS